MTSRKDQYLAKLSLDKRSALLQKSTPDTPTLVTESRTGWEVAPAVEGRVRFVDLRSAQHINDLFEELSIREYLPPGNRDTWGFRMLVDRLKVDEKKRQKTADPGASDTVIEARCKYFTKLSERAVFSLLDQG